MHTKWPNSCDTNIAAYCSLVTYVVTGGFNSYRFEIAYYMSSFGDVYDFGVKTADIWLRYYYNMILRFVGNLIVYFSVAKFFFSASKYINE